MYEGFKKIFTEKSDVYHLSTGYAKTFCGESISGNLKIRGAEGDRPPEDMRVCKKCRSKILNKLNK